MAEAEPCRDPASHPRILKTEGTTYSYPERNRRRRRGTVEAFPTEVPFAKHLIEHLGERVRPVLKARTQLLPAQQPNRNLQFRVLVQNALNPLKELPDYPGQGTASHQLPWRGLDQLHEGGEGVGHTS